MRDDANCLCWCEWGMLYINDSHMLVCETERDPNGFTKQAYGQVLH